MNNKPKKPALMNIPAPAAEKIARYIELWEALNHRELTPEERIEGIHLMEQAKSELFIQAMFTINYRRHSARNTTL